jgi:hypothetical protein
MHNRKTFDRRSFAMVTDRQVRRLLAELAAGRTLTQAAERSDMDEKTARRYRDLGAVPSDVAASHTWRTRTDPFEDDSRLIGEWVDVRIGSEHLQIWYGQKMVDSLPRLRGQRKHRIDYHSLPPDVWKQTHPEAVREYRVAERRDKADRKQLDAARRSLAAHGSR